MPTATPERIRRCNRDVAYAVAQDPTILAARPDAKPSGADNFTMDSFFDNVVHAQVMLNEKFGWLSGERRHEAAECAEPLHIGTDVSVTPTLPRVRMVDETSNLNRAMIVTGIAVDLETERNAIEAQG